MVSHSNASGSRLPSDLASSIPGPTESISSDAGSKEVKGWAQKAISGDKRGGDVGRGAAGGRTSASHPITISPVTKTGNGKLGLCYCPGKNLVREGIKWERDLDLDLDHMKTTHRVDVIVCLLSPAELRSLGVRRDYCEAVVKKGFQLIVHPIVEMAAPDDLSSASALIEDIVEQLEAGKRVAMHCRGGMGRAGMLAACVLLRIGESSTPKEAIEMVRKRRGRGAVESRAQESWVVKYHEGMKKRACVAADGGEPSAPLPAREEGVAK